VRGSSRAIKSATTRCRIDGDAGTRAAVPEAVGPDQRLELAHDDGRLLVDDRAIERPGLAQVCERLADRVRSGGAVHVIRERIVRVEEPQLVVHAGNDGLTIFAAMKFAKTLSSTRR